MPNIIIFNTKAPYIYLPILVTSAHCIRYEFDAIFDTGAPRTEFSDRSLRYAEFAESIPKVTIANGLQIQHSRINLPQIQIGFPGALLEILCGITGTVLLIIMLLSGASQMLRLCPNLQHRCISNSRKLRDKESQHRDIRFTRFEALSTRHVRARDTKPGYFRKRSRLVQRASIKTNELCRKKESRSQCIRFFPGRFCRY